MAGNKFITPRKLIRNLLNEEPEGGDVHSMDEEIIVRMHGAYFEASDVDFRITAVDENKIYIYRKGISEDEKIFSVDLPETKASIEWKKFLKEERENGHGR